MAGSRTRRRCLLSALAFTSVYAVSALAADQGSASVCTGIAASLREQSELLSTRPDLRPVQLLSSGPAPFVELASGSDSARVSNENGIREWKEIDKRFGGINPEKPPINEDDYTAAFDKKFSPDPDLADAVANLIRFQYDEIQTLSRNPMHALSSAGGSANCVTFLFFEVRTNGRSRLLPDPPAAMDGNMEPGVGPHRTECYVSAGYLATIHGRAAFVVADYDPTAFGSDIRVTTWEGGRWSNSCRTKVEFQTKYRVAKAYVADASPVSHDDLLEAAPQIARAMDAASVRRAELSYGPAVPASRREHVRYMIEAAKAGRAQFEDRVHVPKTDNWGNFDVPTSAVVLDPIVLNGTPYLITIGHPIFGWRDEPGYSLIIYQIRSEKLTMIAVAEIAAERGPLQSITVASDSSK